LLSSELFVQSFLFRSFTFWFFSFLFRSFTFWFFSFLSYLWSNSFFRCNFTKFFKRYGLFKWTFTKRSFLLFYLFFSLWWNTIFIIKSFVLIFLISWINVIRRVLSSFCFSPFSFLNFIIWFSKLNTFFNNNFVLWFIIIKYSSAFIISWNYQIKKIDENVNLH